MFRHTAILLILATPFVFGQETSKHVVQRRIICTPVTAKKSKWVPPIYPAEAKKRGVFGRVLVEAVIDKQGVPRGVRVVKGHPLLAKAASDAVKQWRWKPYRLNGEVVELETSISINFDHPR
jgi:TonB family protein